MFASGVNPTAPPKVLPEDEAAMLKALVPFWEQFPNTGTSARADRQETIRIAMNDKTFNFTVLIFQYLRIHVHAVLGYDISHLGHWPLIPESQVFASFRRHRMLPKFRFMKMICTPSTFGSSSTNATT
jgi:hypothetical protein